MPNIVYFLKKVRFCNTIPSIVRKFANYEQYSTSQMNTIKNNDYSIDNEQLARFAKAMGHPARITILQFLASMDSCYFGDIHNELPIAKATVSQHLKELKDAGLIQGEIETPKVKYCINKENWEKAQTFFETFFAMRKGKVGCCN